MRKLEPFILFFLLFAFFGCGDKLPPGMPKLYETVLTITQDGSPLANANVLVISEDYAVVPYSAGGQTDKSGKVRLLTEGRYKGLPAGKYIIAVSKIEGPDVTLPTKVNTDEEIAEYNKLTDEIAKNSFMVVSEDFSDPAKSPLRLEVQRKTTATFDVSPKVKLKPPTDTTRR
ncbi:MAG: carboxypeptidase-like regulatory domain-containing protein [Planctomycetaceae bacterium]|nr:carboxypeptidase-like regulatory domain-containing protein [Planctomycetaceae bacterium]